MARLSSTRARITANIAVSIAIILPALLLPSVSGDRPSHIYNTWLAQLVARGEAPGLRVAPMTTNVLFDWMLAGLASLLPLRVAEKTATSIAVLTFFWGMFALIRAAVRMRSDEPKGWPWRVAPIVAMACYGWTFCVGLMNFYVAIGVANIAIALWWPEKTKLRFWIVALAIVAWIGHPLGFAWLVGAIAWIELSRRVSVMWSGVSIAATIGVMIATRLWLKSRFMVFDWPEPLWIRTGADQFILYREAYRLIGYGTILLLVAWIIEDYISRRKHREPWTQARVPAQLWILLFAAVCILPNGAMLPLYPAALNYVASRTTVLLIALMLCVCASTKWRPWHIASSAIVAIVFFAMIAADGGKLARMSRDADKLVRDVPRQSLVIALIFWPESRLILYHLPDHACAGHCYSYADYEPASQQFRVRTTGPNQIALSDPRAVVDTQVGHYIPQAQDEPIYELYQCHAVDQLCIERLTPGEMNGMAVVRNGFLAGK